MVKNHFTVFLLLLSAFQHCSLFIFREQLWYFHSQIPMVRCLHTLVSLQSFKRRSVEPCMWHCCFPCTAAFASCHHRTGESGEGTTRMVPYSLTHPLGKPFAEEIHDNFSFHGPWHWVDLILAKSLMSEWLVEVHTVSNCACKMRLINCSLLQFLIYARVKATVGAATLSLCATLFAKIVCSFSCCDDISNTLLCPVSLGVYSTSLVALAMMSKQWHVPFSVPVLHF